MARVRSLRFTQKHCALIYYTFYKGNSQCCVEKELERRMSKARVEAGGLDIGNGLDLGITVRYDSSWNQDMILT